MKVILQQDVVKVGKEGEVVTVADGYARNYLFPRNLAVAAAGGALKIHHARVAQEEKRAEQLKAKANQDAATLADKSVTITARAGEADRLYGSITAQDIADAVKSSLNVTVDKRKINLPDPIKALGTFTVPVKLHRDVTIPLSVHVVKAA
jgi:large subunit ribosomal protein L9